MCRSFTSVESRPWFTSKSRPSKRVGCGSSAGVVDVTAVALPSAPEADLQGPTWMDSDDEPMDNEPSVTIAEGTTVPIVDSELDLSARAIRGRLESPPASAAETDFGQTDFGHPYLTDFGQSDFGQTDFGQKKLTDFGQPLLTDFGQNWCFSLLAFLLKKKKMKKKKKKKKKAEKFEAPKGGVTKPGKWAPEGWGPEVWDPEVWGPEE